MKPLKFGLRAWIALTSLLSFLGGWALLAHADQPPVLFTNPVESPAHSQADLPVLEPVPSLEDLNVTGSIQSLPSISSAPRAAANSAAPRLRTRGS